MASRHPKIWSRILLVAFGLSLVALAPLPDLVDTILTWGFVVLMLVFLCGRWWEDRRMRQADQSSGAAISSGDQI
jgi:hypothetical protein